MSASKICICSGSITNWWYTQAACQSVWLMDKPLIIEAEVQAILWRARSGRYMSDTTDYFLVTMKCPCAMSPLGAWRRTFRTQSRPEIYPRMCKWYGRLQYITVANWDGRFSEHCTTCSNLIPNCALVHSKHLKRLLATCRMPSKARVEGATSPRPPRPRLPRVSATWVSAWPRWKCAVVKRGHGSQTRHLPSASQAPREHMRT